MSAILLRIVVLCLRVGTAVSLVLETLGAVETFRFAIPALDFAGSPQVCVRSCARS
jgi:hypothetical protein